MPTTPAPPPRTRAARAATAAITRRIIRPPFAGPSRRCIGPLLGWLKGYRPGDTSSIGISNRNGASPELRRRVGGSSAGEGGRASGASLTAERLGHGWYE